MRQLGEVRHSYMNCENTEECYECAVVSSKNVVQTRLPPALVHKAFFPYEWPITPRRRYLSGCYMCGFCQLDKSKNFIIINDISLRILLPF
jgi:hypothetical protein